MTKGAQGNKPISCNNSLLSELLFTYVSLLSELLFINVSLLSELLFTNVSQFSELYAYTCILTFYATYQVKQTLGQIYLTAAIDYFFTSFCRENFNVA
jgi:hypothetical protein